MIAVAVVVVCLLLVFGVLGGAAMMGYRAAMRAGYEAATIQNLKTIAAVEARYFISHHRAYASLDQLISEQSLSTKFAGHPTIADGYVLNLSVARRADGSSRYKITADPPTESEDVNHFYLDSDDDRIHVNSERQAGPADPSN